MRISRQARFALSILPLSALAVGVLITGAQAIERLDQEVSQGQAHSIHLPASEPVFLSDKTSWIKATPFRCRTLTFFTSYPAKCQDASGHLIWVEHLP